MAVHSEEEKLAGMLAIHKTMTRRWKRSKFHAGQKEWVEKTIFPLNLIVDSALCMGIGSISGDPNGSYRYDENYGSKDKNGEGSDLSNLSQVVAFECWIDILSEYHHLGFSISFALPYFSVDHKSNV